MKKRKTPKVPAPGSERYDAWKNAGIERRMRKDDLLGRPMTIEEREVRGRHKWHKDSDRS